MTGSGHRTRRQRPGARRAAGRACAVRRDRVRQRDAASALCSPCAEPPRPRRARRAADSGVSARPGADRSSTRPRHSTSSSCATASSPRRRPSDRAKGAHLAGRVRRHREARRNSHLHSPVAPADGPRPEVYQPHGERRRADLERARGARPVRARGADLELQVRQPRPARRPVAEASGISRTIAEPVDVYYQIRRERGTRADQRVPDPDRRAGPCSAWRCSLNLETVRT